jgi:uncharacterized membrane protein
MGEIRSAYKILVVKAEGKTVFQKYHMRSWIGFIWLRIGTNAGL